VTRKTSLANNSEACIPNPWYFSLSKTVKEKQKKKGNSLVIKESYTDFVKFRSETGNYVI
jgi:hypothetical protein